jgi:hypothetical protein
VQLYWANGQSEGLGILTGDRKRPAQAVNQVSDRQKRCLYGLATVLTRPKRPFRAGLLGECGPRGPVLTKSRGHEVTTRRARAGQRGESGWRTPLKGAKGAPARVVGPPEKTPSGGLMRPAHLFAAPCPPPRCSPLAKVRSPPSDSHRSAPPKRPSPCGCCTDESVLCTRAVATRATLGCSRVARISPAPDRHRKTVVPAGRRRRGDRPTARAPGVHQRGAPLPENPNVEGSRRDRGRPRAPGHQHASVNPRRPSTAQETGNQRTRVASRT